MNNTSRQATICYQGAVEMKTALQQKTVVQPGGRIEIRSPALPVGATAKVIILLETTSTDHGESVGWPEGFFEQFAGSLPDFPDIDSEGGYEVREKLPELSPGHECVHCTPTRS
jgi:hypothetical protein